MMSGITQYVLILFKSGSTVQYVSVLFKSGLAPIHILPSDSGQVDTVWDYTATRISYCDEQYSTVDIVRGELAIPVTYCDKWYSTVLDRTLQV
jgi:hypothetical protein